MIPGIRAFTRQPDFKALLQKWNQIDREYQKYQKNPEKLHHHHQANHQRMVPRTIGAVARG